MTNIPAVLQPSSTCQWFRLLTVCCQRFTHQPIAFCVVRPTHISLGLAVRAVSLFSSRAAALVSRVTRLRRSTLAHACTPLTKSEENEKKKRDCSQSSCLKDGCVNYVNCIKLLIIIKAKFLKENKNYSLSTLK